jgi:hypothetical protein
MMKDSDIEFKFGEIVYLKTDDDQRARMVTGLSLRPDRAITYGLTLGTNETWHYAIEIDTERDIVKATNG